MKNIAIVEDNDQYATVITEYINKYMNENNVELNIIRFNNADDFLKDYQQIFSVILMDIQMPYMDGYYATHTIRMLPDAVKSAIPIIAMTANAFDEDRQKALNAGMNAHLSKPINEKQIITTLRQFI